MFFFVEECSTQTYYRRPSRKLNIIKGDKDKFVYSIFKSGQVVREEMILAELGSAEDELGDRSHMSRIELVEGIYLQR